MYPPRYAPQTNFPRDEQLTGEISTESMQAEYAMIAETISQIVSFIRRFTTSDGKLALDKAVRAADVIVEDAWTGDAVTVTFDFAQEIDATVDLVRTFVDGVRTDPLSITDTGVTFAVAPAGGAAITAKIYMNVAGVVDRLQSIVQDEGASLIGIADLAGLYDAANVEDALAEIANDLASLITALGDLGAYVLCDGTRPLTGQWEVNERSSVTIAPASAVGAFRVNVNPSDGHYVEINDGVLTTRFEFDNNAIVAAGAVAVTIGATAADSAQSITDAINGSPLAVKAGVSGQNVTLTHEIPYALGNQPLVTSGASITSVTGMAGGVDGSFSAAYKTHYRVRNHPQSLRDGDVVVHEQLQNITGQITAALTAFLRTDGANEMTGPLNVGGNFVHNVLAAVLGTDAVNLTQANSLISAAGLLKLSLAGTKDTVANGTLTGPVTLGQVASTTADVDQTTTPSTVAIPTIHGVAKPGANDQVANKLYVDEQIAALVIGGGSIYPSFNIEGDGLGGGGLATLTPGGEFYFNDLNIAAAQSLTAPIRIFCAGTFTLANTGSISSTAPVEIVALGAVLIQGTISCPHLTIRGGATVTISAAITTSSAVGSYQRKYPYIAPSINGYPIVFGSTNASTYNDWRAVLIEAVGALVISANVTSDDIFVYGGGNVTISSTFKASWYMGTGWSTALNDGIGWHDSYRDSLVYSTGAGRGPGGPGGTAGGAGNAGTVGAGTNADSIYKGSNRPYLLPTYRLARGAFGARNSPAGTPTGDSLHGRGGGRISVYADGNLVITGASFDVSGGDGDDIAGGGADGGGGGAGSARLACQGTMTDGNIDASGGTSNDATGGGGGLAVMVASGFAGTQSRSVAAGGGATAGTSVAATLPAATIAGLKEQSIFGVIPDGF
jgi:hypothetical protein